MKTNTCFAFTAIFLGVAIVGCQDKVKDQCDRGFHATIDHHFDLAISSYTEAVRLDPNCVEAYHGRGLAYTWKNENDKAIADYTEALRLDPKNSGILYDRACTYEYEEDHDNAIADCNEAIRVGMRLADSDEAIRLGMKKEVLLGMRLAGVYCIRGLAYERMGDHEKAVADCTEAIRLNPKCGQAYYSRGLAYKGLHEDDKAEQDFAEAKRLGFSPDKGR